MSTVYSAQVVYAIPRKFLTEEELKILENEDCYISTGYDDQQLVGYTLASIDQYDYLELYESDLYVPEHVHPIIKKYYPRFYLCVGAY